MPTLWNQPLNRLDVQRHTLDLRQLADIRPCELSDGPERGVRALQVRNAAGLAFTMLADRGMGLYDAQYRGAPLAWLSSVGVTHPAYAEQPGFGWLRTWPGGLLTPCGLTQVGSPCTDNGEELGIHGRLSNLAAQRLQYGAGWQNDRYVVWAAGELIETSVFGVNLVMTRRISTTLDEAKLWIEDRVENRGLTSAPLMILQHFNLGWPLVDSTTRLILPAHTTVPRDEAARPGLDRCLEFDEPIDDYAEQVFYHDLQADADGDVEVRLVNPAFNHGQGLGMAWRYPKAEYPILTEWKMMRAGFYAVGVEPGNCHVEGRVKERERGTLQTIAPGEVRTFNLELEFFNNQ